MRPPARLPGREPGRELLVRRGWPRSTAHALLELQPRPRLGGTLYGEWFGAAEALEAAASRSPGGRRLPAHGVLLHPPGTDDRLPVLAGLLAEGAELVVHRPGRRAVLRRRAGGRTTYLKLVRPGRVAALLAAHHAVAVAVGSTAAVPRVLTADERRGVIELAELPGTTLNDLGRRSTGDTRTVGQAWSALGAAVAALHRPLPDAAAFPAGEGLPRHDPAAEALVVDRWLRPVVRWGLLPPLADEALDELLGPLLHDTPTTPSLLHRDLHDKQVVLGPDRGIGLLDLDTASVGEPALDIANVLAHLDLRRRQGLLTPMAAATAWSAFLDGASPGPATMARVPAYGVAAQLRLAAVYALRPPWRGVAASLLASLGTSTTHGRWARQRRRCAPPPLSARR